MRQRQQRLALIDSLWQRRERVADYLFEYSDRKVDGAAYVALVERFAGRLRRGEVRVPLCVYLHVPLCESKCLYCSCFSRRTTHDADAERVATSLIAELDLLGPFFRDTSVAAIHIGGGTPNLLSPSQLDAVLARLSRHFRRGPRSHFGCELNPRGTTAEHLAVLRAHGVDRVSFGVQSASPAALEAVRRGYQTRESVAAAVALARAAAIPAVSLDLIAGLPHETDATFLEGLSWVKALEPDAIIVYRLYAEGTALERSRLGADPSARATRDRQLLLAYRALHPDAAGQEREGDLHAVGWQTPGLFEAGNVYEELRADGGAATLGLGHGARSHLSGTVFAEHHAREADYHAALAGGQMPTMAVRPLSDEVERGRWVGNNLNRQGLSASAYAESFGRALWDDHGLSLEYLLEGGLVEGDRERLEKKLRPDHPSYVQATFLIDALFFPLAELEAGYRRMLARHP